MVTTQNTFRHAYRHARSIAAHSATGQRSKHPVDPLKEPCGSRMLSPLKKPFAARPPLSPRTRCAIHIRFVKHTLKIKYIKRRQISNNITSILPGGTSQRQSYQFGRSIDWI